VVLIGHRGHPEVEGTMGQCRQHGNIYLIETAGEVPQLAVRNPDKLAFVTQTTLSIDDTAEIIETLQRRFPTINGPRKSDICYATQNRQDAAKELARTCGLVLVVGSPNSSNSNRLREIAEKHGTTAHLIDGAEDIRREWLTGVSRIGVTAGASAPEVLVEQVIARLQEWGADSVRDSDGKQEQVVFSLPKELRPDADGV
jgi:4-hydroxy-3-methylbut-2-enyl diphosphate reductase